MRRRLLITVAFATFGWIVVAGLIVLVAKVV